MQAEDSNVLCGPEELWDVPDISLGKYILDQLRSHQGTKTALIDGVTGATVSYAAILSRSLSVADALRVRGVKRGDVIGICSENTLEYCLPALGALFIGATCAPLNPTYTTRELIHTLNLSKPCLVVCSPTSAARLDDASRQLERPFDVVVLGSSVAHNHTPFSSLLSNKSPDVATSLGDQLDAGSDQVAALLSSSGTTGLPKAVMVTHKNILTSIGHIRDARFGALSPDDVVLAILPFFHAYGFVLLVGGLCIGQTIVVLPKFVDSTFLNAIQTHKVTVLMLVPPLLLFLAKHPLVDQHVLTSVKSIWCAAAPLSQDLQTAVVKRIHVKHVRQGYGLTETTLAVTLTPSDWNKDGSSGKLAPGTLGKVVDLTTGAAVGSNVNGELCFKGSLMTKGYVDNAQATADSFDEDGFYHTGDIGYYDQDGFFFIVDRLKELIKYKGFQVPPAELEGVLLTHPSIKNAAVIGIPDEDAGELPLAFVVLQPGQHLTEEQVVKFVADQVSPPKRLRGGVRFCDVIPTSPSGKILRRQLRDVATRPPMT